MMPTPHQLPRRLDPRLRYWRQFLWEPRVAQRLFAVVLIRTVDVDGI